MDGIGMDERNLEAEHAAPRRLVDQLGTCLRKVGQSGADVPDLVCHVMHPGPSLCEEAAHRRVLVERTEQLEPALADADRSSLDSLFLDPCAMLQPGAEEPPVRVQRPVEILDRQTDVVNRFGRLHRAIVCERLGPPMRVPSLALVLVAALLASCGGSGGGTSANENGNGEASKSATAVLTDAKHAATTASSGHVSGDLTSNGTPVTLDLTEASGKGAKGSMSTNGLGFDLVRIGNTLYIRGSDAFYKHFAGAAVAQLLHDKWLKASATQGQLKSVAPLTSIGALFKEIGSHHGKLVNDGASTYHGQKVVVIRDTSDNSKLYVAATGTPYPIAIVGGSKGQSGTISFDRWNQSVSLTPPKGAVDISSFSG